MSPTRRRCLLPLLLIGVIATGADWSAAAAAATAASVAARCLQVDGHARISLPWPSPAPYTILREGGRITLELLRPVRLDAGSLLAAADRCGQSIAVRATDAGVALTFELPAELEVRDARLRNTLVIDLFQRPAAVALSDGTQPAEPPSSSPPPSAPAAEAAAAPAPPAPPPALPPLPPPTPEPLRFSWPSPVAAAAFQRGDSTWLVFDQPSRQDGEALRQAANNNQIEAIEQRPHPRATILRLKSGGPLRPHLERNGNAWIVQFDAEAMPPPGLALTAHPDKEENGSTRLLLPVAEPAEPVAFTDPEAGDSIVVVPVRSLGNGVTRGYDFAQLRLLPSVQGIVIQPLVDDLRVRTFAEGVEVSRPGGLQLSPVSDAVRAMASMSLVPGGSRLIPEAAWPRPTTPEFAAGLVDLNQALSRASDADRPKALLDLARFYVAAGLGAEADAALQQQQAAQPGAEDDPQSRLLRGIARWLHGRRDAAAADLRLPAIGAVDEGRMWQTVAGDGKVDPAALPGWSTIVAGYPAALRRIVGPALLNAAVSAGATPAAAELLASLRTLIPDTTAQTWFDYQDGRIRAAAGDVDGAVVAWSKAIDSDAIDAGARAGFDRVQLLRREGRMTVQEAIDALDRLRFTWRGDELQFQTLRELGRLQSEAGDSLAALRSWRDAVSQFPHHPESPALTQAMTEMFGRTFTDAAPTAIAPWKTVALFEEFKELIPADERGHALLTGYANRLAAADLRPQAAAILEKLLATARSGDEKAKTALKLAELYLTDGKAEPALAMAQTADRPALSAGQQRQRRIVVARALLALQRPDQALAAISGDRGTDVDTIRLAAYRSKGDWPAAAAMLERLGSDPTTAAGKGDPAAGERLLDRVAALTLANDRDRLSQLRDDPGRPATDTPAGQAVELMTRPKNAIPPQKDAIAAAVADAEKLAAAAKRSAAAARPAAPASPPAADAGAAKTGH